jgi:hypothetical protein
MTTPTQQHDAGSQPIQTTTVENVTAPGENKTDKSQKKGLGAVVAWLTIPGILLLLLIVAYFGLAALKSNTEQQGMRPSIMRQV